MTTMIYKYKFKDGIILKLVDVGLSVEEIWKLEEIHGSIIDQSASRSEIQDEGRVVVG